MANKICFCKLKKEEKSKKWDDDSKEKKSKTIMQYSKQMI